MNRTSAVASQLARWTCILGDEHTAFRHSSCVASIWNPVSRRWTGSYTANMAQLWVIDVVNILVFPGPRPRCPLHRHTRIHSRARQGMLLSTRTPRCRPFYRPPGNPVLVGSDTFGRVQSGIPTHRYGGPAFKVFMPHMTVQYYIGAQLMGRG